MVLGVIVHPVLHIALHGNHEIDHGHDLAGHCQFACAMLKDAVKRPNAGIANEDRCADHGDGQRNVPPMEGQLAQGNAKHDHGDEQRQAECRIAEG